MRKITSWLKNLFSRRVIGSNPQQITQAHLAHLNPALEMSRAIAEGEAIAQRSKRKKAEEKLVQVEQVDLSKHFHDQEHYIKNGFLEGSFSLKNFFNYQRRALKTSYLDRILGKKPPVNAMSECLSHSFGPIWDIVVVPNSGGISVVGKDEHGRLVSLITGESFRDIVKNYQNMKEGASFGQMVLNATADGNYFPDMMAEDVEEIKTGPNGKVFLDRGDKEPFRNLLQDRMVQLRRTQQQMVALKEDNELLHAKNEAQKIALQLEKTKGELQAAMSTTNIEEVGHIQQVFSSIKKDLAQLSFGKDIAETRYDLMYEKLMAMREKYHESLPKEDRQRVMEMFDEMARMFKQNTPQTMLIQEKKEETPPEPGPPMKSPDDMGLT